MKLLLLLIVIVIAGVLLGWFHFSSSNDAGRPNVTLSVDKDKIEADKNTVVDKVQDLGRKPAGKAPATLPAARD